MGGSSDGHMNHGALGHCSNGLRCVGQRSDDFVFSLWTQDLTNCEQDPHRGGGGGRYSLSHENRTFITKTWKLVMNRCWNYIF